QGEIRRGQPGGRCLREGGQRAEALQCAAVLRTRGAQQGLGLLLEVLEAGTLGEGRGHHTTSMPRPGFATGGTAVYEPSIVVGRSGLGPSREPAGASRRTGVTLGAGGRRVNPPVAAPLPASPRCRPPRSPAARTPCHGRRRRARRRARSRRESCRPVPSVRA